MSKIRTWLAWLLAVLAIIAGILNFWVELGVISQGDFSFELADISWTLWIPGSFGILGALIVSNHERNIVGWLMLVTALFAANPLSPYLESLPPQELTAGWWLVLWFEGWSWILFLFPIFLIPLYFPDGKLPSPRWKWVNVLALGMWLFLALLGAFVEQIGPAAENWKVPNPIGFIPLSILGDAFFMAWGLGLMTVAGGSLASLLVRYRHAGQAMRDQIKWILFAAVIFFFTYGFLLFTLAIASDLKWGGLLLMVSMLVFPITITIAILRHRLYDINLIIRRTLQYTLITALLALVYFGGIVVLQGLVGSMTGVANYPIITVVTTLGIAALFNPLRRRVQEFVDRRFYRSKYDAEQALARFASVARDEVDLDRLMDALNGLVAETMQPVKVSTWMVGLKK